MRSIVDDFQIVGVGDLLYAFHIAGMSVAMHRHDGSGLRRDGGFDLVRIEVECVRVDVHEHRLNTVPQQGMGGSDK